MITIKYHSVLNRTARIDGAKNYKQVVYAMGDKPPNYPVPATLDNAMRANQLNIGLHLEIYQLWYDWWLTQRS